MMMTKKLIIAAVTALALASCSKPSVFTETVEKIEKIKFQETIDGKQVDLYTLTNNEIGIKVTNYGARVVALCVPDLNGKPVDVVLGHDKISDYIDLPQSYYGASIGRYGNRICNAKFTIDSVEYQLVANNGKNALHGGIKGFSDVVWTVKEVTASKIVFAYLSSDGEEGYPGNLNVTMTYELTDDNAFRIDYAAITDKATVCNLTHHSFFNLSGEGEATINDHVLTINSNAITPVDSTLIPTGEIVPVQNTPFDFNTPMVVGERINSNDLQMKYGGGYDHNWVVNRSGEGVVLAATVYSPVTKIKMDVLTDQPGMQFYAGNFIDGTYIGKQGKAYNYRSALCLETQHFPDSPNQPQFPSTLLLPGENYNHVCIYKFSVMK
jgi:aldose 1-epimerase